MRDTAFVPKGRISQTMGMVGRNHATRYKVNKLSLYLVLLALGAMWMNDRWNGSIFFSGGEQIVLCIRKTQRQNTRDSRDSQLTSVKNKYHKRGTSEEIQHKAIIQLHLSVIGRTEKVTTLNDNDNDDDDDDDDDANRVTKRGKANISKIRNMSILAVAITSGVEIIRKGFVS